MIITEFYFGQGLGNQLHVYVTTRAIAEDRGVDFGFLGLENLGDRRYNGNGLYFMDLDLGKPVNPEEIVHHYREKEVRVITNNSHHDATLGCDIRLPDPDLKNLPDNCKIDGTMQSDEYIYHRREDIKKWLKLKPEHENKDFMSDDICVLNIRDYEGNDELFLSRDYWVRAIYHMLRMNPNMQFLVITENPDMAKRLLPELQENVYHFDVGRDYATIKNAKWLILSNSSFAYFPALTNEVANLIIAPKYWARHNVSDGYWATGCNLYRGFVYMDRVGNLQSYDECKREFELYKKNNPELYKLYNA
jgi:hypothetical protein